MPNRPIALKPENTSLMRSLFMAESICAQAGYHEREETRPLWDFDLGNRMGVPTGLIPRVVRLLSEHGYQVTLIDHRRYQEPFAVDEAFHGLTVVYHLAPQRAGARVLWLPTPGCKAIDKLRKYGVPFHGEKPVLRNAQHPRIVVLVAFTEQARELAKRLPAWEVMDVVPNKPTKDDGTVGEDTLPPGKIVTETNSGVLCFKDFPPPLTAKEKKDVIVTDFTDTFDGRAIEDAERRRREYDLLGWDDEAAPPG